MAKPKRKGGPKQKLSPEAAKKKAIRDKEIAMTPRRTEMKADNQRKRREAAKKYGKLWLLGKEYDHTKGKFTTTKENRGEYGKGTRKGVKNGEGKKNK